jgi:hypothetical protein
MNRRQSLSKKQLIAAAALALASSVAIADDSSMSVLTGDSYAYFNNLDYRAGKFNVARMPQANQQDAAAKPANAVETTRPAATERAKPAVSGTRPALGNRSGPFRDDTGA